MIIINLNQSAVIKPELEFNHDHSIKFVDKHDEFNSEMKLLSNSLSAHLGTENGAKIGAKIEVGLYEHKLGDEDISLTNSVLTGSSHVGYDDDSGAINAMVKANVIKSEVKAGPLGISAGIGFDTGFKADKDGIGAYVGGTGLTLGPKTDFSILGLGFSIDWTKLFG